MCVPAAGSELPSVTTDGVASGGITTTQARFSGNITNLGSSPVAQHGFCRGPVADPGLDGAGVVCSQLGPLDAAGAFSATATGLSPGTLYHVRAYATNAAGSAFGESRSFSTGVPLPAPTDAVATTDIDAHVRVSWSPVAGAARYVVRIDGTTEVEAASPYLDTAASPGTVTSCTPTASSNTSADRVSLRCEGGRVADGPSRGYEVLAVGSAGRGTASAVVTGRRSGGSLRYGWERSIGEEPSGFGTWGGAPTAESGDDTDVPFNTVRQYRVVLAAGAGVEPVVTTYVPGRRGLAPVVESLPSSELTAVSALLNGAVTSLGGAPAATGLGFCWSADTTLGECSGPSVTRPCADGWTDTAALGETSPFSVRVELAPGTTYRVCAYAANDVGVAHGENVAFASPMEPPTVPSGVSATSSRDDDVRVDWLDVSGATGYEISVDGGAWMETDGSPYYDRSALAGAISGCTPTATDGASATEVRLSCQGASVTDGPSRSYRVRAVGPGGAGGPSDAVLGRRSGGALSYAWERSAADLAIGSSFAGWDSSPTADSGVDSSTPFNFPRYYRVRLAAGAGVPEVTTPSDRGYRGVAPVVVTGAATDVGVESATLLGTVVDLGGASSTTDAGFCLRQTTAATDCAGTSSAVPCATGWTRVEFGAAVTERFEVRLTSLTPSSVYHACAYAATGVGTSASYGDIVSWTTDAPPPEAPTGVSATTSRPDDVLITWSPVAGASSFELEIDGSGVWTAVPPLAFLDAAAPAPTLTACTALASDGTTADEVTLDCIGGSASPGALRSYRVRAIGPGGTSGPSAAVTGRRTAGTRSYQWQRSAADSDASYSDLGGGAASPAASDAMGGIAPPSGRFYRVVVSAAGAVSTTSNSDRGNRAALPTVATDEVWTGTIDTTSAAVDGRLLDLGGAPTVAQHGFCFAATADPAVGAAGVSCSTHGPRSLTGRFSSTLTGLAPGTSYHLRAYATNVAGTSYGTDQGFTTDALQLGSRCAVDTECASGLCASQAVDAANQRCAPLELPTAAGGAMAFVYVPPTPVGGFAQGSPATEADRASDETQWQATITRAYFVARTEVTQGQWKAATGGLNPSYYQDGTCTSGTCASTENANDGAPVERVDWWSAAAYANWMSEQAGLSPCYTFAPTDWDRSVANWAGGDSDGGLAATSIGWSGPGCSGYRLLTESEWEWACRGPVGSGTLTTAYFWGPSFYDPYVWWFGNAGSRTHLVGTKAANGYALRDTAGNVAEWLWDWYATYPAGPLEDYTGPTTDTRRVYRGTSVSSGYTGARSARRGSLEPTTRAQTVGFRLARTLVP
ncbi:MAG: SUMF1/EgtB/PvdO family nonheme iron enzyme [Myxococcales bacterium]|nr:SUMF1/EgtB/PvdO family nonheme iron enzyme [Myxococcales bacterium]